LTFIVEAPILIIDLVAVLQRKSVDVDDDGLFAGKLDGLFEIVDSFAFAGGDQNARRVRGFFGHLVIETDIRQIIRNMFFGVPVDRFFELFAAHRRQNDVLDDDRMTADAGDDLGGVDVMVVAHVLDHFGNRVQLHNLSVDNRVVGKIFKSQTDQTQIVHFAFELDHFDRTRTDVQTGNAFLFTEQHFLFTPLALFAGAPVLIF
jgi:hypothetical protein